MNSKAFTPYVVLRPEQVAEMLQITVKTLAQWRYQRRYLPFHRPPREEPLFQAPRSSLAVSFSG